MRIILTTAVFLAVTIAGTDLARRQDAPWGYAVALLVAVLAAAVVHRLFPGRHHGSMEGDCARCRGEGYAFYGTGRASYRRRCLTCRGSGAARDARRGSRRAALRPGGIVALDGEPAAREPVTG